MNQLLLSESKTAVTVFADTKPHYNILDGLRGVAALTVVCFHLFEAFATSHVDQRINHGYLAVDFFFVLSGFVVGYAYDDRWKTMAIKDFLKRRFIRLHPMVVMGALIGAVMFYFQGCGAWDVSQVSAPRLLVATILNACLIPASPSFEIRGVGEMFPLNGPSCAQVADEALFASSEIATALVGSVTRPRDAPPGHPGDLPRAAAGVR
nr:hypothetical protein [Tanacetum cinerariifolium]